MYSVVVDVVVAVVVAAVVDVFAVAATVVAVVVVVVVAAAATTIIILYYFIIIIMYATDRQGLQFQLTLVVWAELRSLQNIAKSPAACHKDLSPTTTTVS